MRNILINTNRHVTVVVYSVYIIIIMKKKCNKIRISGGRVNRTHRRYLVNQSDGRISTYNLYILIIKKNK